MSRGELFLWACLALFALATAYELLVQPLLARRRIDIGAWLRSLLRRR